jgi:glutathionylspermidine synthase
MLQLQKLKNSPDKHLQKLGWDWMLGKDTLTYLTQEVLKVSEKEADNYYQAANELYEMLVIAGQYLIDNQLFSSLDIPPNLIELIRFTWEDDRHLHLYGRFDFAGGVDGKAIKLIEFNADTATCLPETAVVQWSHLQANGLEKTLQFNTLYEDLRNNFIRLKNLNMDLQPRILFSTLRETPEDETNVNLLAEAAKEAGFEVGFAYIDEIDFSANEGIFVKDKILSRNDDKNYIHYPFWFKLLPWEYIALDEPELLDILTPMIINRKAVVINPAYVMLFQSKGILKTLWDLFPNHKLLLETSNKPLIHRPLSVEKVMYGREGANVKIVDKNGKSQFEEDSEYGFYAKIYQEFTEFPKDSEGYYYQAGVFFAYQGCGLGFRRGGKILNNTAQFVGHFVE